MMQEFWDQRYDTKEFVYGRHPNAFFRDFIDTHKAGSVLLPAEGEGRNAVYAALKGWAVTAFDFSTKARNKAIELCREYGVEIDYRISSIEEFETKNHYDAIALIFLHLPSATRRQMHRRLMNFLKPGGYFLLEAFSQKQIQYNTGGPQNLDLLYERQELMDDISKLELVYFKEKLRTLDEGPYHRGKAEVMQLIARKLN
jgi:SAM-dependent methyltransferase